MTKIGTGASRMQFISINMRNTTSCTVPLLFLMYRSNNCHDFAACALNQMELPQYKNHTFNCTNLALLAFTRGHFLGFGSFLLSWLPFILIVVIIIASIVLSLVCYKKHAVDETYSVCSTNCGHSCTLCPVSLQLAHTGSFVQSRVQWPSWKQLRHSTALLHFLAVCLRCLEC